MFLSFWERVLEVFSRERCYWKFCTSSSDITVHREVRKTCHVGSAFADKHVLDTNGSTDILLKNNTKLSLDNLIVAPMVQHNILSIRHLVTKGYTVTFSLTEDMIVRDKAGLTVASAPWDEKSGGYFLHCTNTFSDKQFVLLHIPTNLLLVKYYTTGLVMLVPSTLSVSSCHTQAC